MERRKRNLLVVLIGIVIVVAMVSSFGLGLFAPDTAKIVLPTPEVSQQPGGEPGVPVDAGSAPDLWDCGW